MKENDNFFEPLDDEEKELEKLIKSNKLISVKDKEEKIKEAKLYAKSTMNKNKRMNIRISERDLHNLKTKALEEGLPYQTLVSMVLHKYITGQLHEKAS